MEQRPIKGLPTVGWTAAENVRGITAQNLDGKTTREVRETMHHSALQVNPVLALMPLHADGYGSTSLEPDSANQTIGRMPVANKVIPVYGAKRAHPPQAVDGLQQTRLTRPIGAGDSIERGGKRQPCALDISKILNIKCLQPRGRGRN